jgi:hypothetical protein
LFKDKYVCSSITNKKWFVFHKHRWEKDEGQRLRMAISKDLFELYSEKQNQYLQESQHFEPNEDQHEKLQRKIKKIAERFGAEVPFLRPLEFARDNSSDLDVFKHYIFWLKKAKKKIPNLIVHLRPTTPLRDRKKLSKAISLMLRKKNASCLRSFTYSDFSPYKTWKYKKNEEVEKLNLSDTTLGCYNSRKIKTDVLRAGEVLDLGDGALLKIIYPDKEPTGKDTNEFSIVAELYYGNSSFIFTGDAPTDVLNYLSKTILFQYLLLK